MSDNDRAQRNVEGTHLVVEYSDCDPGILDDKSAIESLMVRAAETTGAPIVARVMHRFRPSGVTGCIILSNAHLTIHTWPQARYASVDLYTSGICDPHDAHAVLETGLNSQQSQLLVVDRGLDNPERMRVRGHRLVASYTLDCRSPYLPEGIHVGRSAGRGFGLFASRDFSAGELIYDTPGRLAEWDAEFIVEHDVGRSVHNADSLGYELSPDTIEVWPKQIRDAIAQHFALENPSLDVIHQSVTGDYEKEVLMTAFDGLKNHSSDPNTVMEWSAATIRFDEQGVPHWSIPTRAAKPIRRGEEMLVDYCVSLSGYVPPRDWLP